MTMALSTLVVDDEPLARDGLRGLLEEDPEIGAIHEATDGPGALAAIAARRPDIVFLDVQMPGMDGFAVVRALAEPRPIIVFVTAHDRYAVRAFEINALDYVLKPVTRERFRRTLTRAKASRLVPADDRGRQMQAVLDALTPGRYVSRLAVPTTAGRIAFVGVETIDFIQAAGNYAEIHCGQTRHLLHTTMGTLEDALDPEMFVRVHRSAIVNRSRIAALEPALHGEYHVILRSGVQIKSGRTYGERLRALKTNPF